MKTTKADTVRLSNPEKILFPDTGFTKRQLAEYYSRVAEVLLPHFRDRPVTLKRFPDGVEGKFFYEKDAPNFTPGWVTTAGVPRRDDTQPPIRYIVINDRETLVWCANLAAIELHPFLHKTANLQRPTSIVFDLDPGEGADILNCIEIALLLRRLIGDLKLQSFAKVSGSKGLQLYIPLNSTEATYELTQSFAKSVAQLMEERYPDRIVARMAKRLRPGKVFIDWSQNSDFKTTVGVYSLRAKSATPFASLPFAWEELQEALKARRPERLHVEPEAALARIEKVGDLFAPVLKLRQKLPAAAVAAVQKETTSGKAKSLAALRTYKSKRDFSKTAEPPPVVRRSRKGSRRRFVIQKHAASHLHYDFRLEMYGVLKSWAVPKGLPTEKGVARLAMPTEDHPLDYLDFEGVIPKGQYGGGTVMVWDIGTYDIVDGSYYEGVLRFSLAGAKLKGQWELRRQKRDGREAWILLKVHGSMRSISAKRNDQSAISGRTMAEIAAAQDAARQSNRVA